MCVCVCVCVNGYVGMVFTSYYDMIFLFVYYVSLLLCTYSVYAFMPVLSLHSLLLWILSIDSSSFLA